MDHAHHFFSLFQTPLLAVDPQNTVFPVVFLFILLLLSFVVSGAEVALFSLHSKDVNMLKTKQHSAAKRIISLLEERKAVYTSLLIASGVFNISIVILTNFLLSPLLHFGVIHIFIPIDIDMLIKIVIISFMLVFFARMFPKVWASQNTIRFAYSVSSVVEALHLLLRKISLSLVAIADQISETSGANESEAASMKELDDAIEISNVQTSIEEKNILKGIVKFTNISVRQIMTFRLDVNGIDIKTPFTAVVKKIEEQHYSRYPVYKNSLDEIVGMLNTKDLLPYLGEKRVESGEKGRVESGERRAGEERRAESGDRSVGERGEVEWRELVRPILFVPESKLIRDLLKEFQTKRIHFAVVVDEFGGTSGIVTMEDILEEIIGDIRDEFDEEENAVKKIDDETYIADAKIMLYDLCRAMRLPIDTFDSVKGESDSLAGLVLELAGAFPSLNETISSGDFDFAVMEIERNRIKTVRISINHQRNDQ